MRILVTGGAGFIGSNFIRLVLETRPGWRIVNYDALTYAGNLENLRDIEGDNRYRFVRGDICEGAALAELFGEESFDAVVNFAAESHVDRSILESAAFLRTNVLGTQVLLEAARAAGVKRFLHISTDEVYGSLGSTGLFEETDPLKPNSPYASSKASADLLCRAWFKTYDFPVVITRSSNNYGPWQFPEKLIPLMINNALGDRPLPIYGDGRQVRDWIHVRDNCAGLLAALEKGIPGRAYNIGGGNEIENIDLVRQLLEILGKPESLIKYVTDRPGHDRRYALSCQRALLELDWEPLIPFETGLRETVDWYRVNRAWCDNVTSGAYQEYYQRNYGGR